MVYEGKELWDKLGREGSTLDPLLPGEGTLAAFKVEFEKGRPCCKAFKQPLRATLKFRHSFSVTEKFNLT